MSHNSPKYKDLINSLTALTKKTPNNKHTKDSLLDLIRFSGVCADKPLELSDQEARLLINTLVDLNPNYLYYEIFNSLSPDHWSQANIRAISYLSLKAKVFAKNVSQENKASPIPIEKLIAHVQLEEDTEGLLNLICIHVLTYNNLTANIPTCFSVHFDSADSSVRLSTATLLFISDEISSEKFIEFYLACLQDTDTLIHNHNILSLLLLSSSVSKREKIKIASSVYPAYAAKHKHLASKLKISLKKLLDSELSGLRNQETWNDLKLPADTFPIITPS